MGRVHEAAARLEHAVSRFAPAGGGGGSSGSPGASRSGSPGRANLVASSRGHVYHA